ncbi:MAG: hypothetical protein ACFBRM_16410 [Pikeienuella sp.]
MMDVTPINLPLQEPKLGVVCGLEDELKVLGRWRRHKMVLTGVTGANPLRTRRAVFAMWKEGARMILSWGVAGALSPDLAPGDLILPDGVVGPDGATHPLASHLFPEEAGAPDEAPMLIAGADTMVLRAADRAALRTRTGAVAVDMETHIIA